MKIYTNVHDMVQVRRALVQINGALQVKDDDADFVSKDEAIVRFDGTDGKTFQDSRVTIDDKGNMAATGIKQRIRYFGVAEVRSTEPTAVKGMAWLDTAASVTSSIGIRTVSSITANTTIDATYDVVLVDATTAAVTVTLPLAATRAGKQFDIKKIDSSGNTVTIDGDGTETIDGGLTAVLSGQYESVTIISDGTEWHVL